MEDNQEDSEETSPPVSEPATSPQWMVITPGFEDLKENHLFHSTDQVVDFLADCDNAGDDLDDIKVYKIQEVSFVVERKTEVSLGGIGTVNGETE